MTKPKPGGNDMTHPTNGRSQTMPSPFRDLSDAIMRVGSARNRQETIARVGHCQQMVHAIEQGFTLQAQERARLLQLVLRATGGQAIQPALNLPQGWASVQFEDSTEPPRPVHVLDVDRGILLLLPDYIQPLVAVVTMQDGKTERMTLTEANPVEQSTPALDT